MKITLIHPPQLNVLDDKQYPPLNLMYLASNVIAKGFDCEIVDLASHTPDQWERKIGHADIYGITCYTPSFGNVRKIAQLTKKINPKSIVAVGGVHPSSVPQDVKKYSEFDYIFAGEAEHTFSDFVSDYAKGKKMEKMIFGKPIENLDEPPFPARHLLDLKSYNARLLGKRITGMITSRGCPYGRAYCNKSIFGRRVRMRSPENVIAEVSEVIDKYGISSFNFYDDIFTLNKPRLYSILDELKKMNITFLCQGRANLDSYNDFVRLYESGCREIGFGIESGSQRILNNIHKESTVEQNRKAVLNAKKAGLITKAYFMIGLPGENKESVKETKKFIEDTSPDLCNLYTFVPLPSTPTWECPQKYGIEIINKDFENYYIISKDGTGGINIKHKDMSTEEFIELRKYLMDFLKDKYGKYKDPGVKSID